jgi:hypothetical protein
MSKHKSPEQKLGITHVAKVHIMRANQKIRSKARHPEPLPPKGTNADNQFR